MPAEMPRSYLTKGVEVVQNPSASTSMLKRGLKEQFCP